MGKENEKSVEDTEVSINVTPDESTSLLNKKTDTKKPSSTFFKGAELVEAGASGAAKMYAGFGSVAVHYDKGNWLIAPVAAGMVLTISEKAFKQLMEKYPEQDWLKTAEKAARAGRWFLVEGSKEFGFAISLALSLAGQVENESYFNKNTALNAAMISSGVVALSLRGMDYFKKESRLFDITGMTFAAMTASSFGLQLLKQQNVIAKDSLLPVYLGAGLGSIGLLAGILKQISPKATLLLNGLIEMIAANPSLAAVILAIPSDLEAERNPEHDISDTFFYSFAALASLCLLMFTVCKGVEFKEDWEKIDVEALDRVVESASDRELSPEAFENLDSDKENKENSDSDDKNNLNI